MGLVEGKVGIVPGTTSGIGARTAGLFVEEGARGAKGRLHGPGAEGEALASTLGANALRTSGSA
jgi:hypothetical protein